MVKSFSRWFSPDTKKGYIKLNTVENYLDLSLVLYYFDKSVLKDYQVDLLSEGGNVYSYTNNLDINFIDNFKISSGSIEVLHFKSDDSNPSQGISVKRQRVEIPKGLLESENLNNAVYRFWGEEKFSVINGSFSLNNVFKITKSVSSDRPFEHSFNPINASREEINSMLESPIELFEGKTGFAHYIQEENKIVIPLSNRVSTWTEEYNADTFSENSVVTFTDADTSPISPLRNVANSKIDVVSKKTFQFSNFGREYREYSDTNIPNVFNTDIRDIERILIGNVFELSVYGFFNPQFGFTTEDTGGLITY